MALEQLTVVGTGLIGGSVCLAAKRSQFARRIVAINRRPKPDGVQVADEWICSDQSEAVQDSLSKSSLTVLCLPVRTIGDQLLSILEATSGVVTDCGSTKAHLAGLTDGHPKAGQYIPGHPMAGHPEGGLKHARPDLFDDRRWILCPEARNPEAAELVRQLIASCGAQLIEMTPELHDRSVAATSHVPQVIASALSVLVDHRSAAATAGPGFASATRVAGGAEAMWRDIFVTNGGEIGSALGDLASRLQSLSTSLKAGEVGEALELLEEARNLRDRNE